jgi:four helix bundle protein
MPENVPLPRRAPDIVMRTFRFAQSIIRICKELEQTSGVSRIFLNQLMRSGTSIGANLEEAQAGQTRADFAHKCAIALKESRETLYWLRLIESSDVRFDKLFPGILTEASEISRVLGAIVATASRNARTNAK